ncbi:hypothetical protein WN48_06191 [Eufriesea mexicana]|uniref:Uncharacterized protein n=1 Tax=Eufriesea mexicana TaxID=516756 RepID=A0A310SJX2_9HYME|nr:hypothetical protein WN48_06191 [Eufriesea mexicana]
MPSGSIFHRPDHHTHTTLAITTGVNSTSFTEIVRWRIDQEQTINLHPWLTTIYWKPLMAIRSRRLHPPACSTAFPTRAAYAVAKKCGDLGASNKSLEIRVENGGVTINEAWSRMQREAPEFSYI